MKNGLKLKIPELECFIEEAKSGRIKDARVGCFYKIVPSKQVNSLTYFYVVVTAAREDGVIIEYEEETGHEISYFKEDIKAISKKTDERKDALIAQLKSSGLKAKIGRWVNE